MKGRIFWPTEKVIRKFGKRKAQLRRIIKDVNLKRKVNA